MSENRKTVRVDHALFAPVRHPIKVARLLYSAPPWVLAGPIYLVALMTFTSLAYSFWGTKDELVIAPMVLERESVTIEAVKGGIVSKIMVQEGTRVDARETLLNVQMTSVMTNPEEDAIQSQLRELQKEIDSGQDEIDHKDKQLRLTLKQAEISIKDVLKNRKHLEQDIGREKRNVQHWTKKLQQAKAELREERALYKSRDITKVEFERSKAKVDDIDKSVRDAQAKLNKTVISLESLSREKIQNEITQVKNEIAQSQHRWGERLERYNEQRKGLEQRLQEAKKLLQKGGVDQSRLMTGYKSLFSGLVTRVYVKPGNMIAPGSPLVTIVKDSAALEGRALVKNQDIGQMKRGQEVRIKYFAYPYQTYGIPSGFISDIAVKPGGVEGQESMYVVRVALNEETISKRGGREHPLEIGLEGIAEIKTGEKRFIELLFSPISRFFTQEEE
ncbi:MAG: HlyD family efflux transporter periplasmic adaptor subunit [Magnetococcales bacterium]|nr:HlyD family efflux transporter periplasmic adaptor subunit [Magnetococcales bacterium]